MVRAASAGPMAGPDPAPQRISETRAPGEERYFLGGSTC